MGLLRDLLSARWGNQTPTRIHFLHVGKTGGSAIKHALKNHTMVNDGKLILHRHKTNIADVPIGEKICFVLRDPVSRFVSAFYSRQRKGQPRYNSEWSDVEKEVFATFATANDMAVELGGGDQQELAVKAMTKIGHFQPYRKWYGSLDAFRDRESDVLFVGFQEQLDRDFLMLLKALNINEELTLPQDEILAHRNPANVDRSISEQGVINLHQWYEEDYVFIDLCKRWMNESYL